MQGSLPDYIEKHVIFCLFPAGFDGYVLDELFGFVLEGELALAEENLLSLSPLLIALGILLLTKSLIDISLTQLTATHIQ